MQRIFERIDAWAIALCFAVGMVSAWMIGCRRGRRFPSEPGDDSGSKFVDASVVLLGLLLAFTFSMALGGHEQRRSAVVAESNAIGDFYTCATLLSEPHRSKLQGIIRDYAGALLSSPDEDMTLAQQNASIQRSMEYYSQMTEIVDEANSEGPWIALALTNALNNVSSTAAVRFAAYRTRTPWSIVVLLFLSALVPSYLIGEKQGAIKMLHLSGVLSFMILVTAVIFVTLDLDQPHGGMIKVSRNSLARVVQSMGNSSR
jgi:hypothetical protein